MATVYWLGTAEAVAQVTTVTVGGTFSGEDFEISVGGEVIASYTQDGSDDADAIASALVAAWNGSSSPYATGITAALTGSTGELTLTADTAGVPFAVTLNTPGGSATLGQTATTANAGPNDWSTAANWSSGATPTSSDDVVIERGGSILWLPSSEQELNSLSVKHTFAGRIGLAAETFQVTASSNSSERTEYRTQYLKAQTATASIGEISGTGGQGSDRIKIDFGSSTAVTATVHRTRNNAAETGRQPVRLLADHSSAILRVIAGQVGVGTDTPGETGELSAVHVLAKSSAAAKVNVGGGITLATWTQAQGQHRVETAPTTVNVEGGELNLVGSGTVTNLNVRGKVDLNESTKTITNASVYGGATYTADFSTVTHTNGIDLVQCGLSDVTLDLGRHLTLTPSSI